MQGTYTGVRVSYKNPKTKEMVDVLVGTEERLYKTNQKAEAHWRRCTSESKPEGQYHADYDTAIFVFNSNQNGQDFRIWSDG